MSIMKNPPGRRSGAVLLALAVISVGMAVPSFAKLENPLKLVSFLQIELPGWKLAEGYPQANRVQDKERSFLQADAVFSSGKSTISVFIKEGEIAREVGMFNAFRENEDEEGYCRKISFQGFKAVDQTIKKAKSAFLFILVAENCLVIMKATEAEDTKVLKDLANKIDLSKLAALVK